MLTCEISLEENSVLPSARYSSAGYDIVAISVEEKNDNVFLFHTGLRICPMSGYYAELYARSSIYKLDMMLANGVGIIDPDYRGEIMVVMRYVGNDGEGLKVAQDMVGKRIAQLIFREINEAEFVGVRGLSKTFRGESGFGSTGDV